MCVLGNRLLTDVDLKDCHKNLGPLRDIFCGNSSDPTSTCDPYWESNNVTQVKGIKGLSSGVFLGKCSRRFSKILIVLILGIGVARDFRFKKLNRCSIFYSVSTDTFPLISPEYLI